MNNWPNHLFFATDSDTSPCSYSKLKGLAMDEGKSVGFEKDLASQNCETSCNDNDKCESFTFCESATGALSCYFKDKKISTPSSEPLAVDRPQCFTFYKDCGKGKIKRSSNIKCVINVQ